jgi:hypothetical protein
MAFFVVTEKYSDKANPETLSFHHSCYECLTSIIVKSEACKAYKAIHNHEQ